MTLPIQWIGERPDDANDWERLIRERADKVQGAGGAVRIRAVTEGWFIEAARGTSPLSMAPPGQAPVENRAPFDFRWHITEELRKAGKRVIGVEMLQGGPPLSPEREAAIRFAQGQSGEAPVESDRMLYDAQVVADLLAEIDRLRAKLELAAHARDLVGQAGSKLRDACEDISPRPARSFERALPRGASAPDPKE